MFSHAVLAHRPSRARLHGAYKRAWTRFLEGEIHVTFQVLFEDVPSMSAAAGASAQQHIAALPCVLAVFSMDGVHMQHGTRLDVLPRVAV